MLLCLFGLLNKSWSQSSDVITVGYLLVKKHLNMDYRYHSFYDCQCPPDWKYPTLDELNYILFNSNYLIGVSTTNRYFIGDWSKNEYQQGTVFVTKNTVDRARWDHFESKFRLDEHPAWQQSSVVISGRNIGQQSPGLGWGGGNTDNIIICVKRKQ